ncbi:MAG: prenyltransferase [Alistipes sp.]|nr:prenyltransferase [Alistipes sp.]
MLRTIRFWLDNARSIALPQSLLPALTAVALSYGENEFNALAAVAAVAGVVFLHLAFNLLDDWFDYRVGSAEARRKVADEGFRGRIVKYPYLTSGAATHAQLLRAVAVMLLLAALMGAIIVAVRGRAVFGWIAAAFVIGTSYSGGPLKLGFRGLGEWVIFVMFGPLLMTGVYYAITGSVGWDIVWLSTAVGLLVANIVYSHSVLDAVPDEKMGKKTMAHLAGSGKGRIVLSALLNTVPYALVATGAALGQLHPAYLAATAVLPVSLWLVKSLDDFVCGRETLSEPRWWMGPMGDFDKYRGAGLDWFMLRWLTARNIVTMFCALLIMVNLILGTR